MVSRGGENLTTSEALQSIFLQQMMRCANHGNEIRNFVHSGDIIIVIGDVIIIMISINNILIIVIVV